MRFFVRANFGAVIAGRVMGHDFRKKEAALRPTAAAGCVSEDRVMFLQHRCNAGRCILTANHGSQRDCVEMHNANALKIGLRHAFGFDSGARACRLDRSTLPANRQMPGQASTQELGRLSEIAR